MRKKCVRWTKSVRATLVVAIAAVAALGGTIGAQTSDPSSLPLLTAANFQYLGGFRLPRETVNGDSFSYGGRPIAFSPTTNSLYVSSRAGRLAEVTIPDGINSSDVTKMPFATYLQPFADPTEGHLSEVGSGVALDGLIVYGDKLYGTASMYYDATNAQRVSHYSHSLQLNQPSFSGWSQVWETGKAGFVSGFMSVVPAQWRALLGGPAATGQCCVPIVSRTSWGPAAVAFDPAKVGQASVSGTALLYYDGAHPTLGNWSGSNTTYGATTQMGGMVMVAGTRTVLFIGRNGMGAYCYGNGTGDQNLVGTASADGSHWCYDPTSGDKGTHAYPYRYQVWAYDMNDLAAVKAGTKQPWQVVPYGVWPFDLPTFEKAVKIGGVTYDPARQLLYVSQMGADKDGYASRPIIHAFQLDLPPAPVPEPPPSPVDAVTLTANKIAPQAPNSTITMTANVTGGVAPHQFKWFVTDGTTWTPVGGWTASNTFTWTPTAANANAQVGVWARSSWNSTDAGEATAALPFAITTPVAAAPAVISKVSSVTVTADRTAPQVTGTPIKWTAAPTGGSGPLQYKWWVYDGVNWVIYSHWSTSNTFTWTPGVASNFFKISVWVKSNGNSKDEAESSVSSSAFSIAGKTLVSVPPPPQTSLKVLWAQIAPNKAAPQTTNTTVTWTATSVGGPASLLYKWWIFDGSTWTAQGGWTTSHTFAWTPSSPNAKYKVAAWVKGAGNSADAAEAQMSFEYVVTGSTP